jgi:hypothetical protein
MSHFAVMVVSDTRPNEDVLGPILQPWHEFECTGVDDEYVVWVDETQRYLDEYEGRTSHRLHWVFDEHGKPMFSRYGDRAKPYAVGQDLSQDLILPDGWCEREVIPNEIFPTFESYMREHVEWGEDEYQRIRDGKVERYTNPHKKWDYWTIGGRWTGSLLGKDRKKHSYLRWDQADIETARNKAARAADALYSRYENLLAGRKPPLSWQERRALFDDVELAREAHGADQLAQEIILNFRDDFGWITDPIGEFKLGRAAFVRKGMAQAFCFYAFVKDGQWHERGQMGWWGMASNEKTAEEWHETFNRLTESIRPDQWVSIVDCHI